MGEHIDLRAQARKKKLKEHDTNARQVRVSFKRYLRDLEEEQLLNDLEMDPVPDTDRDD
jgi:hypothetical protein